ncbi:MAG: hypothetical protein SV775_14360, partial [Thermodesulfobacteriota bacterium]|nr:hypothetical protein [Thermodesulfobacteriota bacterium]
AEDDYSIPDYGPVSSVKRPVRTRMRGVVGAGGEKPPATRLANISAFSGLVIIFCHHSGRF